MPVLIDYSRDQNLSKQALDLLTQYYMLPDETSPQDAFARATVYSPDQERRQRLYDYVSKGWFMYASPVLSNAPREGEEPKAMPISCFLGYVADTRTGLVEHRNETAWLTFMGGGVGGHWSDVRAISEKSNGPLPHIHVIDSMMLSDKQAQTRKGSYAAYMDCDNPEIIEFIESRLKTGGDPNRKCFNINTAINVTDKFMTAVVNDEIWELKCPHSGAVKDTIKARKLWQKIIESRFKDGEPYVNFIDTANAALPQALKDRGLKIRGSNLCNEIHLPTNEDRTAVCCLSSLNLEKWDEWKDTTIVEDLICFLDDVLQFFIDHAPEPLHRAKYSAMRERSLGLGFMGFHSLLQKNLIPFESQAAIDLQEEIFSEVNRRAKAESLRLGTERGEAPDMEGTGMRNAHLFAIAPNANSSIILGCSPSIEPWASNAITHRTRAGTHFVQNKYLDSIFKERMPDRVDEMWASVVHNKGSVQHLSFLTDEEKATFKTAFELDQSWVVRHAADRQKYICQGQSVNLFFPFGSLAKWVSDVHILAWQSGLKGLYYLRTEKGKKGDAVGNRIERKALGDVVNTLPPKSDLEENRCVACEG